MEMEMKKDVVIRKCQICNRKTKHALRTIDQKETYVCLICESNPENTPTKIDVRKIFDEEVDKTRASFNVPWG